MNKFIEKKISRIKSKYKLLKRTKAKLTDLEILSFDIPDLITKEKYIHNDFYFNAHHIKKYIKRPDKNFIRASIEHGIYASYTYWDCDTNCKFPGILTMGEIRRPILEKICPQKQIHTIGPYINYVKRLLNDADMKKEKKKLGKNLLVFPAHSTHHIEQEFDNEKFCEKITELSKDFDSVTICLYWKDILLKGASDYLDLGFNCVCAGHIYDPMFLPRLKSIIELSDQVVSNITGTHLGYSLFLGKPVHLFKTPMKIISLGEFAKDITKELSVSIERETELEKFYQYFADFHPEITKEQWDFANQYFGFDQVKSKEELAEIINSFDTLYN